MMTDAEREVWLARSFVELADTLARRVRIDEAFELLGVYSRRNNRRLSAVAADVITGALPAVALLHAN
jgi:hypothetical protein